MRTLKGKRVLITGAAAGIGRALALAIAKQDGPLVLIDIDEDGMESLAAEIGSKVPVQTYACDLSQPMKITQLVRNVLRSGPIDVLVNNAGVAYYGPTENMTQQQWDWLLAINLHAPIQLTHELLPSMLERPEPHIVNMCSISGMVAGGRFAAYHVSKFGLIGFTEALRAEFGRRGMGVSAICPGPVQTDLYKNGVSGRVGQTLPEPPKLMSATPEQIANRTVRAIQRNKRMTLITPTAHVLYNLKRFAPGLIDFASQFSRKRFRRRREAKRLVEQQVAEYEQARKAA